MIIIKTKRETAIVDEKNVATIEFEKNTSEVWIKFIMPDGNYKSELYINATSVEYRPSTEQFTITQNDL